MDFDISSRQQRALVAVVVLIAAVALGGVAAVALNIGPFSASAGDGGSAGGGGASTATAPPTGTVYTDMSAAGGESGPPFSFAIKNIEKCGRTCRDVTATVVNKQNETATSVTVFTRIYAGNTTKQNNRIWRGQEDIGTLNPGEKATRTQRVKLSTTEAFTVKRKDGWITILTTVRSNETTITFKDRRDVA